MNLESIHRVPSSTLRRPGGFAICTLTKVLAEIIDLVILSIAGVLTAVFLTTNISTTSETSITLSTMPIVTATTSTTTATTTSVTTATTTTTITSTIPTTAGRRAFALSQVINGQTVTCSSVVNTNLSYTKCDDLQEGGLYAPNGITCKNAWSTTQSSYWSTIAFCQAFLNSNNTYIQAYYDCNTSQTRFTWSNGVWGTTNDKMDIKKNLRCYY